MYSKEEISAITLNSFAELSYDTKRALLNNFTSSEPDFEKYENKLIKMLSGGVYNKVRANFSGAKYVKAMLADLEEKGIECVTLFSENYPERLRHIPSPPLVLYLRGDKSLLGTRCFSIVGSRRTRPDTLAICRKTAETLSEKFTVVSGIAQGADTEAVNGAMARSGKVISVLANGFDHAYPAVNTYLMEEIAKGGGLLVTEYSPSVRPEKYFFPFRNRIIAGLSDGTLVVSGGVKSGAMITANYAADFGRDVFAFPHSLGYANGEGCNNLIKNGAYLTTGAEDILSVFGMDCESAFPDLTEEERELYDYALESGEVFLPEVAAKLGKPLFKVIPTATALTIKKLLVSLGGNRYGAIK